LNTAAKSSAMKSCLDTLT